MELTFQSILAHKELMAQAMKLYREGTNLFPAGYTPHLSMLWDACITVFIRNKQGKRERLSPTIMTARILDILQASDNIDDLVMERCDSILSGIASGNVPSLEEGKDLLADTAAKAFKRQISVAAVSNADLLELRKTVEKHTESLNSLSAPEEPKKQYVFSPFKEMRSLAVKYNRVPTGLAWLDDITRGGGRAGDIWLFLGPSGGGKTVTAVQFSCAQALLGNGVLWATYEQSVEGDLAERMIANVTDISLSKIRDIGYDNFEPEVREAFEHAVEGVADKLIVMDMTRIETDYVNDNKDDKGMYTIWKEYKKLKEQGVKVKTIIVDWMGELLSMVSSVSGIDITNAASFAANAQKQIDIMRAMAKEEGVTIICFHQTNTVAQGQKPIFVPDKTCAYNMKSMCNYFDIVITLGIRDKHDVCWVNGAKVRKGAAQQKTIKLIGDKCRFEMAPGYIPNRDGNFYNPLEEEDYDEGTQESDTDFASMYSRELG